MVEAVITYRDWDPLDRELANILERCFSDIRQLQDEVDAEGCVIFSRLGTPKVNPKHKVLERMIRRSIALSRRYDEISERYSPKSTEKGDN